MYNIKTIPTSVEVWASEDCIALDILAKRLREKLTEMPYAITDSLIIDNSGPTPISTTYARNLFTQLDYIFYNIGINPYDKRATYCQFKTYDLYHKNFTAFSSTDFGVRLFWNKRYSPETVWEDSTYGWEELKTIELTLQEDRKHFIKVLKNENTLLIFSNRWSWELYFKAKALQYRFFEDKSQTYNKDVIECILALANKDIDTFNKYINKILNYKTWEKYRYAKFLKCFKSSRETRLKEKESRIKEYAYKIEQLENELKDFLRYYRDCLEEYNLLYNTKETVDPNEIVDYLINHRYIKEIKYKSEELVELYIEAPITYFDQDLAEEYWTSTDEQDYFLKEVFVNRTYKMWVHCKVELNTHSFKTFPITIGDEGTYYPHPHVDRYRCQGNHPNEIRKWINEYDYIGCIEQIMTMVYNLNFSDATVVNEMLYQLDEMYGNIKCFEDKDGNFITYNELIEKMPKEETTDETVTPFD